MPRLNPWIQDYVQSDFIADVGLGIFIYIVSLFIIINIAKAISSTVTWTGLGVVDKSFVDTRKLIGYKLPSYNQMIKEMIAEIDNNPLLYKHYNF